MKNFKKLAAIVMAATMVVGSGVTAIAASEGGDTGHGSYEGFVEESSVFSVDVPTDAANVFDYFIDPNGLLAATDYERFGGVSAGDDFEPGATLFFTRTVSGGDAKYGSSSDEVELTNMSSYAVNVEVSATVVGGNVGGNNGIVMTADSDVTDPSVTRPTIYLAIESDSKTEPIISGGAKLITQIAGSPENFKMKWNSETGKYEFAEIETTQPWKTTSFNLVGACGGTWTAAQEDALPSIALTWKVTDPKANAAKECKLQTIATSGSGVGTDITASIGSDKGVYIKVDDAFLTTDASKLTKVSVNGTELTITTKGNSAGNGNAVYFKFPAGTQLTSGAVITIVLDGVTYTYTLN